MSVSAFAAVFASAFGMVALKAFSQLNVVHHRLGAVWPTSLGLACMEFLVVVEIAKGNPYCILPLWLGGALGCTLSMVLHKRWRDRGAS